MNKLDLELFEILDNEIDKTLRKGVFIGNPRQDYKYLYEFIRKGTRHWENTIHHHFQWWRYEFILWEWKEIKVFWYYPTTNEILRYVHKKTWWAQISLFKQVIFIHEIKGDNKFTLDITKPIQQQTDKQKQELIDFLKLIK